MTGWQKIVGHDWVVELLQKGLTHDRLGHAYLITGPAHVGKTTLAITFAQAVNCEAEMPAERPCLDCRSCQLIAGNRHPDIHLLEPSRSGRGKLTLKIDEIRELQKRLLLASYEARTKVAIITNFDSATVGAANAFLKTLEEPPPNVIIILTAVDGESMLPTVNSRCRSISLRPLSQPLIERSLRLQWDVDSEQSHLLSHVADGKLGWAVQLFADESQLSERLDKINLLYEALDGDTVTRFQLADKLAKDGERLPALLQTWLSWWRDITLLSWGDSDKMRLTNLDQQAQFHRYLPLWTRESALASLNQTKQALWQLERNANTRLVLENLLMIYPEST